MQAALADNYPTRPVRVITLTAPGGSLDILARTLAQSLSEAAGQQFYVENKVGAGGNLGVAELARSAADGYTIGMITVSTHGINPGLSDRSCRSTPSRISSFSPWRRNSRTPWW